MGGVNFVRDDDIKLETTKAKFSNILKRHAELTERVSRDSDKMIFEHLRKEFESARASQTREICLDGEQWNDGLLATIRERVHMEADSKAMPADTSTLNDPQFEESLTYRVGNKMICCLEGARIGIQYETHFAGEPCELYHCVLETKSFLEKMAVVEHTIPFFLPVREIENELLSSNAIKFIDHVGDILQAYVHRREQVRIVKDLYQNQIADLYHSLPYHLVEFVIDEFDCKVTVSLRYADLLDVLPTRVKVLAWPRHQIKKICTSSMEGEENEGLRSRPVPVRLSYAEDTLKNLFLPEACTQIKYNLPQAFEEVFQKMGPT